MIVLDASAALAALVNAGPARDAVASEQIHAPHLIDVEVLSGLRRLAGSAEASAAQAEAALSVWRRLALTRYPMAPHAGRIWELRDNVSSYDACYVALAEALGCSLVTADGRLARAPGLRCTVAVVPR